jgi:hypothetical protein
VKIFLIWTILETIANKILFLLPRRLTQEKEQVLPHVRSLRKEKGIPGMDAKFLKELTSLRESNSEFDDNTCFCSLLPLMKILSPQAIVMFLIETHQNLMQTMS